MSNNQITERHRQLALQHARLIQERKDVESEVVFAIEELMDFPTDPESTSARPSQADIAAFRRLSQSFQVSDFDSLVEERTAVQKCGYVFCPRPLKKDHRGTGRYSRIIWSESTGSELKVVPSEKYDVWCDVACAKRAMYIKMQLSELPAWERTGRSRPEMDIMYGDVTSELLKKMEQLSLGNYTSESAVTRAFAELALERGKQGISTDMGLDMVADVKEKATRNTAPFTDQSIQSSEKVEGYIPRIQSRNILQTNQDT